MTAKSLLLSAGDGTAVPAGSVGGVITSSISGSFAQATPTENTYYDVTNGSISVTTGNWLFAVKMPVQFNYTSDTSQKIPWVMGAVRNGSNTVISMSPMGLAYSLTSTANGYVGTYNCVFTLNVASTTTYKLSFKWRNALGGTITVSAINVPEDSATFDYYGEAFIRATRIA